MAAIRSRVPADRWSLPLDIGDGVVEVLATAGDTPGTDATKLLRELGRPGITRQEQFELAKAGLAAPIE